MRNLMTLTKYLTQNNLAGNSYQAKSKILAGKAYVNDEETPCLNPDFELGNTSDWSHRKIDKYIFLKQKIQLSIEISTKEDFYNGVEIQVKAKAFQGKNLVAEASETGHSPSISCNYCGE